MKATTVSVLLSAAFLAAIIWMNHQHDQELAALQQTVTQIQKVRDEAITRITSLEQETSTLRTALEVAASRPQEPVPPTNEVGFENALDSWISRVRNLSAYLQRHPEKRIPQMDLLTDEEWLDVTRGNLETEADYREALGKLRGMARQKAAADIGRAIKAATAANGGRDPETAQEIAAFLPAGFDREILNQLSPNPSGEIVGVRSTGSAANTRFVLVDTPVDLWDATMFYSTDGTYGLRAAVAPGQFQIKAAIASFTETYGHPPTNITQLLQSPGVSAIDQAARDEIFKALTTSPSF